VEYIRWTLRLLGDVFGMGVINRSFALALAILFLLGVGMVVAGAQATAPFIYTLF